MTASSVASMAARKRGRWRGWGWVGGVAEGGEGESVVAAAIGARGAGAAESEDGAGGEAFEVAAVEGGVGGDDDDDAAVAGGWGGLAEFAVDGDAGDHEVAAIVGLDEDADGVSGGGDAGGGADAALPAEGDGAGPGADGAFGDGTGAGGFECGEDIVGADGTAAYVVEGAVVGFGDDGIDAADVFVAGEGEHPGGEGVGDAPDVEGGREEDGCFDFAEFVDLGGADELAEAVGGEDGGGDFLAEEVAVVGEDGGDAGADAVVATEGGVADADAGDVGDGVEGAGGHGAEEDAGVAGAETGLGGEDGGGEKEEREKAGGEHGFSLERLARRGTGRGRRRKICA